MKIEFCCAIMGKIVGESIMLNIAIVDDEKQWYDTLKEYLKRYSAEHGIEICTEWFTNPIAFLDGKTKQYSMILLDIKMPYMDGLEMAHKIRESDPDVSIVFVTNMKQYVIRGYEVAADFILKPISYYDFAMKMERVIKKIQNNEKEERIRINDNGTIRVFSMNDIRYVDVSNHRLTYHLEDAVYEERGTISKIEETFLKNGFARCNNYCLVNLRFVAGLEKYSLFVLKTFNSKEYDTLQLSRLRKSELIARLNNYLHGGDFQ